MATLERKRKPVIQSNNTIEKDDNEQDDDLTNDPILDGLSKEPMEYNSCLSTQVVQSLESVKHICLQVLDILLLKLVKDAPCKHQRRLSANNLLDSITQNTNRLQETTNMKRSQSSPPAMNISDVYRILENNHHQLNNYDYTLSCSLAALLNDVYRLLELNSSNLFNQKVLPITNDVALLQQQLHEQVSNFQSERAQGIIKIDELDASTEMLILWDEMDHLMNIVNGLILQLPPVYNLKNETEISPPAYDSVVETGHDLDLLLNAIDRLSTVAPQLNNQRVELTTKQVNELAAETLGKTVARLSCKRMENQRAFLPLKSKQELLQDLILQVQTSASRSLDNQRVTLSINQQRKIDIASFDRILDRLDDKRFKNQDFISNEELLIQDLTHTTDLLVKSLNRSAFQRQRFSMSAIKERNLLNRPKSQSMTLNPDYNDLNQLLDNIYKSKPQFNNQRASFSL